MLKHELEELDAEAFLDWRGVSTNKPSTSRKKRGSCRYKMLAYGRESDELPKSRRHSQALDKSH